MIRLQSLAFAADKQQMMMQLGWWDPEKKLARPRMTVMCMETLKAFQTHMRLKGDAFDVEYMADFCMKREQLGPELCKVVIFDGTGGVGAELTKDMTIQITSTATEFNIEEFKERIKGYSHDQLAGVQGLAAKNDHQDVVDAVTNELERRKV